MVKPELATIRFRWKKVDWVVTLNVWEREDVTDVVLVEMSAADLNGHLIAHDIAVSMVDDDKMAFVKRSIKVLEKHRSTEG